MNAGDLPNSDGQVTRAKRIGRPHQETANQEHLHPAVILRRARFDRAQAGRKLGIVLGWADILDEVTDPVRTDLGIDWHAAGMAMGVPERDAAGFALLGVAS